MRFLVTGGAGFIGSNIAFELQGQGHEVTVIDNFSSGDYKNLLGFKGDIVACDLLDPYWTEALHGKFDAIFHEAAITDTTIHDQKKMMENNVEAFRNLLYYALDNDINRVVYASSAGVYGNSACPMTETSVPTPENIYGFSKAIMDNVSRAFAQQYKGMVLVGLRYFNVYGPGEYYKKGAASMMFQLYNQMKAGKTPRIFKHGEQERDFVYIKDVVAANMLALKAPESCIVNVGTGTPENFNKVIACLNKELGLAMKTEYFDNPYPFYQNKTQAQPDAAAANIGYKAQWPLARGIADYVKILDSRK